MPEVDALEMVWRTLQDEIKAVSRNVEQLRIQYERAGVSDGIPASTLANAPLAAMGGVANGTSYITIRWISNGRKSGEGAGLGTGVLAIYNAAGDNWLNVDGYAAVTV